MIEPLTKLYTEDQNRRITAALGDKPEPKDLTPRFLLALNERNLEKVGDHLSEDVRHVINQVIHVLKLWLNRVITLNVASDAIDAASRAVVVADAARDALDALDPPDTDDALAARAALLAAARAAYYAALAADADFAAYYAVTNSLYWSANIAANIGNREQELNWQVNKLIELIGGE